MTERLRRILGLGAALALFSAACPSVAYADSEVDADVEQSRDADAGADDSGRAAEADIGPDSLDAIEVIEDSELLDAPPPEVETEAPNAAPSLAPARMPLPEVAELQAVVDALTQLLAGRLPPEFDAHRLFDVDPTIEAAVGVRRVALRASILLAQTELDEAPPTPSDRAPRLRLLMARDGLRLEFLARPLAERKQAMAAHEKRQAIAAEQASATEAARDASAMAESAEAGKRTALAEVALAGGGVLEQFAMERVRVEGIRAAIARTRSDLAQQQSRHLEVSTRRLEMAHAAATRLDMPELSGAEADALLARLEGELALVRPELSQALDDRGAESAFPDFTPTVDLDAPDSLAHPVERDALVRTINALTTARVAGLDSERELIAARVRTRTEELRTLQALAFRALPRLSRAARSRWLSLSREGLSHASAETRFVILNARVYASARFGPTWSPRAWLAARLEQSAARWAALQILLLLALTIFAWRRHAALSKWIVDSAVARVQDHTLTPIARLWARRLVPVLWALALGAVVWLAESRLVVIDAAPEFLIAATLFRIYAWYRVFLALAELVVLGVGRDAGIADETDSRATIRWVARYVLALVFLRHVIAAAIGPGYLWHAVPLLGWLGALPLTYLLLRRWRGPVTERYAARFPGSAMAGYLERRANRLGGAFLVAAAAVHLVVAGTSAWVASLALRFDRTRRTLAFLFRRQMEKSATSVGRGPRNISELPADLVKVVIAEPPDAPAPDAPLEHEEAILEAIAKWQAGEAAPGVALVGERGAGKTTWLNRIASVAATTPDTEITYALMEQSLHTAEAVCHALAEALGITCEPTPDALVEALETGPRRIVLLDHCQNFILRAMNGTHGFDALGDIVRRTSPNVFWVCSFSRYMWSFLLFSTRGQDVFRTVIRLSRWSEEDIGALIDARMSAAGWTAVWDDLLPPRVASADRDFERTRMRERYLRLLWDYSDGNPRAALHFWLRSLVVDGEHQVRVRLFDGPSPNELEWLSTESRFLLAAVVLHENLSSDETARVLRISDKHGLAVFEQLLARGVLEFANGRYRLAPLWSRAALRYLTRKNLLET
ncbi:MAG: hypothetical protein R3F39_12385 [Myxococcota bacterium]